MGLGPAGVSPLAGPRRELRALTGLRGLCAMTVVLAHYDLRDLHPVFGAALWHNAAVDVFFVLSGFTMFYVHGRERERLDFGDFVARRIARLWPLAVATTLLAIVPRWLLAARAGAGGGAGAAPGIDALDVARQLLMVNGWPFVGSGVHYDTPQWSISVEFLLYLLLFPALYWCSDRLRALPGAALVAGALALMLLSLLAYVSGFNVELPPDAPGLSVLASVLGPTVRGVCGFAAGCLAYYYCLARGEARAWASDAASLLALAIVVAGTFRPSLFDALILLAPALVALNASGASVTGRLLASRPMHRLGVVSYSLYLIHAPLFFYSAFLVSSVNKVIPLPGDLQMGAKIVGLLLIVPVSLLSYAYLEAPARARLYAVATRVRRSRAGAPWTERRDRG